MLIFIATFCLLALHQGQCGMFATVKLRAHGTSVSRGSLTFVQDNADSDVTIYGTVTGLNLSSVHGFHVHTYPVEADSPNCESAGPHFNPYNVPHGPQNTDIGHRHVGDLGNITTDSEGNADVQKSDKIISLYNETRSILNRSVVIHLNRDDGGQGGFNDSITSGNAGARVACGLIVVWIADESTTTTVDTPTALFTTSDENSTEPENSTTATPSTTTFTTPSTSSTPENTSPELSTTTAAPSTTTAEYNTTMTGAPSATTGKNLQPILLLLMGIMIVAHRVSI